MDARIDHVVLWVDDPSSTAEFYQRVVGLTAVRLEAFRAGAAPFPSLRVNDESIIDLMARGAAPAVDAMVGNTGPGSGHPVNHVCLALTRADFESLLSRLHQHGVAVSPFMERSSGARGEAPRAFYFRDPDGNTIEARYYEG